MSVATRCLAVAVRFAGALGLLGACATVALASPRTVTRANAAAVAREINLRAGDLKLRTVGGLSANPQASQTILQCAEKLPRPHPWAAAHSPALTNDAQTLTIAAGTLIVPTATLAATDLRALATKHARDCIAAVLRSDLASSFHHATVSVTAQPYSSAFHGGTGPLGIRVLARIAQTRSGGGTARARFYTDLFLTGYGQALIQLSAQSARVPSAQLERQLAALLLARAHTALG